MSEWKKINHDYLDYEDSSEHFQEWHLSKPIVSKDKGEISFDLLFVLTKRDNCPYTLFINIVLNKKLRSDRMMIDMKYFDNIDKAKNEAEKLFKEFNSNICIYADSLKEVE